MSEMQNEFADTYSVYEFLAREITNYINNNEEAPWHKANFTRKYNKATGIPYKGINLLILPQSGGYFSKSQIEKFSLKIKENAKPCKIITTTPYWIDPLGNIYTLSDFPYGYPTQNDIVEFSLIKKESLSIIEAYHESDIDAIKNAQYPIPKLPSFSYMEYALVLIRRGMKINKGKNHYNLNKDILYTTRNDIRNGSWELLKLLILAAAHPRRLNISTLNQKHNKQFYKKQLIEEIGAGFLMDIFGWHDAKPETIENWIPIIKEEPSILYEATQTVQKIIDFINREAKSESLQARLKQEIYSPDLKKDSILRYRALSRNTNTGSTDEYNSTPLLNIIEKIKKEDSNECTKLPLFYEVIAFIIAYLIFILILPFLQEGIIVLALHI